MVGWFGDIRKTIDALPCRSRVLAPPQPSLTGSEVKNLPIIRVHCETLTIASAALVAAELEWHVRALESSSTIARTQDCAIWSLRIRVGATGKINAVRIRRIDCNALDTHQVQIRIGNPVQKRLPAAALSIPAVGAANVSASVAQTLFFWMKDDAINKAATHDLNILPGIGLGSKFARLILRDC